MRPTPSADLTTLYRFFGADAELLYIGIAVDPWRRMKQHRGTKAWWADVATIRMQQFATRVEALKAEALAIQTERPQHNIIHNGVSALSARSSKSVAADVDQLSEFIEADPSIGCLVAAAKLIGGRDADTEYACACRYFYLAKPSLRDLVVCLVGWERDQGPSLLRTPVAYDVVYSAVYNSLPNCGEGCWGFGVPGVDLPDQPQDVLKAALMVSPYWASHMKDIYAFAAAEAAQ